MKKTQKEIQNEIEAMKNIRLKIRPRSIFGDDNLAQFDAQLYVLENNLDTDDIYDEYDHSGIDKEVLSAAEYAREWLDGNTGDESLVDDWPLKGEDEDYG